MPRIARKNSQSCFYHVIVQGINKEYIFDKEEYIRKYKEFIIKKLEGSPINILAYCIMNNHAHLLIYSESSEILGKYMQRVNTAFSRFYNNFNKRVGYVFRNRYYSQDILTQKQLYNCLRYIHNNPVKACITKTMKEYKHSSYNEFLGKKEIINEESILLLFGVTKNFEEQFNFIHSHTLINEEEFMDVKEKEIYNFINEIEEKYKKPIKDIRTNRDMLENTIMEARKQTDVTITQLAEILDISKTTVWKYAKK